jgi:hypothetical protein
MRFTVLQDFYSAETQSQYVSGLSYTVRAADVRLHKLIARWIAEGKIVEGGSEAIVAGKE